MGTFLSIVLGMIIGAWAVQVHWTPPAARPLIFMGSVGGLLLIVITLASPVLIIFGLASLFRS